MFPPARIYILLLLTSSKFLQSSPLNPTGFKIALELLLKAPIPKGGIAEVPFSFGTRSVGESKLSSKVCSCIVQVRLFTDVVQVMLRYVGQLYSLYWWSWGIFFPISVVVLGAVGSALVLFAVQQADQRLGLGLGLRLGRLGQPRKKLKSEV
jgi:dolichol-phosphate mannosyltransferase